MAVGFSGSNGGILEEEKRNGGIIGEQKNVSGNILQENNFKNVLREMPLEVSYFINNVCNLSCRHCYVAYKKSDSGLTLPEWFSLFDSLIDISLDGDQKAHDQIRGIGAYEKLMENLKRMSKYDIIEKVFISFTASALNIVTFPELIQIVYDLGIKKILVSPYVGREDRSEELHLSNLEISNWAESLLQGAIIDFKKYSGLNIYVKSDYTTTGELAKEFLSRGIINKDNLRADQHGVIFTKYSFDNNVVYFNYLPSDNSFVQAIRISHDGYISDCHSMFFSDYPKRAIGNVREKPIAEILAPYRSSLAAV